MDELPELQSDADVDALMARLRARLDTAPARAGSAAPALTPSAPADGWQDLLAAQETLVSTVVRAMTVMVETLEDAAADAGQARPAVPRTRARRRRR